MLLYIFLILGQLFALSPEQTILECTERAAARLTKRGTHNVSLVATAQSCIDVYKKKGLKGVEKIQVLGATVDKTIHKVDLLINGKKWPSHYFNLPSSVLCNVKQNAKSAVGELFVDIKAAMSEAKNSATANSCRDSNLSPIEFLGGNAYFTGFGLKRGEDGKCVRKCGNEGEIMIGHRAPFVFYEQDSVIEMGVVDKKDFGMGAAVIDEQFLRVECQKCPKNKAPEYSTYTITHKDSNECFDENGCAEGTVYLPREKRGPKFLSFGADGNCVRACSRIETRNKDGNCVNDAKKECENLKETLVRIKNLAEHFQNMSPLTKIGTCDFSDLQKKLKEWAFDADQSMSPYIKTGCRQDVIWGRSYQKFFVYSAYKEHKWECLGTVDKSDRLSYDAYLKLQENVMFPEINELEINKY